LCGSKETERKRGLQPYEGKPLLEEYATKLYVEYLDALIIPQQHSFIFLKV